MGLLLVASHSNTHITTFIDVLKMSYSGCAGRGSVAEISCNVTGPSPAMLAAAGRTGLPCGGEMSDRQRR